MPTTHENCDYSRCVSPESTSAKVKPSYVSLLPFHDAVTRSRVLPCAICSFALAGCTNKAAEPGCTGEHTLAAVAADADPTGPIYVADSISGLPGSYVVERAGTLSPIFQGTPDDTKLGLLVPSTGGVVLVNGGASARRFSTSGALLWTIGYAATPEVRAALTADDQLFIADLEGVRAYDLDATLLFKHVLPSRALKLLQVISDLNGGAWVLGAGDLSAWQPGSEPSNLFVAHFDRDGALLDAHTWQGSTEERDNQIVMSVSDDDTPRLLLQRRQYGGSLDVTALGTAGTELWTVTVPDGQPLEADAEGVAFSIRYVGDTVDVERWDTTGNIDASATVTHAPSGTSGASLVVARLRGGLLVGGTWLGTENAVMCPRGHFLSRVQSSDLGATSIPLGMR